MLSRPLAFLVRTTVSLCAAAVFAPGLAAEAAMEESKPAAASSAPSSDSPLARLVDELPEYLADRLPMLDPNGVVRVFLQPHFGDFVRQGYIRVPFGVRAKLSDNIEVKSEFGSYFENGGNAHSSGLSAMNLGVKCERVLPGVKDGGFSLGVNYRTPFSGSPQEFSDGYRHLQPYMSATHPMLPKWQLLGFASVGANFLEHTSLPSNFGRNQLHANSLAVTTGVARAFGRVHVALTTRLATTALMSDERRQNFSIKPEMIVPLRRNPHARVQAYATFGVRTIWGPDGCETGTNTSLRVNVRLGRKSKAAERSLADAFPR